MEELAVKKAGLVNEADFEATVIEVSPAANATIQPEPPQSVPENVSSLAVDEQEQKL